MASLPFVGDISTKGMLKGLQEERTKKEMAVARADIAIARVRGSFCTDFLYNAELHLEAGQVNPGEVCELIDRCYKGYSPRLLHSALVALTQTSSQSVANQVINRIDDLHRANGRLTPNVDAPRLLHPAGG